MPRVGMALLAIGALVSATQLAAYADTSQMKPDQQKYATANGVDPYSDQDLHVAITAGTPEAVSFVHFNLSTLPRGSTVDSLAMTLTPNSNSTQNVTTTAQFGQNMLACLEIKPFPTPQLDTTAYDCTKLHVSVQVQANGTWKADLAPLINQWNSSGNTGLALVPVDSSNGVEPMLGTTHDSWVVSFDSTKTSASVAYTPPAPVSTNDAALNAVESPILYPLPPVTAALPIQPQPAPVPAPTSQPSVRTQPQFVVSSSPKFSQPWLYVLVALAAAAVTLLAVAFSQQLARAGEGFALASMGRALISARSRMATPVAVLALAGIISAGYAGQMVTSVKSTGGGGGGSAGSGGSTAGGAGAGQAGGGTGSGGGAAGGGAGSQAFANGSTGAGGSGGGPLVPGVTPTQVVIGMSYATDTNPNNAAFGVDSSVNNFGDTQKQAEVVVDYINKHGGVAGRQLVIKWQVESNANQDPNAPDAACRTYTEDYHVFAAIEFVNKLSTEACYAQHHTLVFDLSPEQGDQAYYRQLYPYLWTPSDMATDRQMVTKIQGLNAQKYFSFPSGTAPALGGLKVGVVMADNPQMDDIYNHVTVPELAKIGVNSVESFKVRESSIQALASDEQSAVIKFQQDGVTHVMVQGSAGGGAGGVALLFMLGAYKQQYHPRYGLGSNDAPGVLEGYQRQQGQQPVMDDQLKNALAVGWSEGADVEQPNADPWPPTRAGAEKRCYDIEAAAGISFSDRTGFLIAAEQCDALFLIQQASQGLTTLNAQALSDRAQNIGSNYQVASGYAGYIGYNHFDGSEGYRLLHEETNCDNGNESVCFKFTTPDTYPPLSVGSGEP